NKLLLLSSIINLVTFASLICHRVVKQMCNYQLGIFFMLCAIAAVIPFLFEDAPMGLTQNCAVGAIHELPLRE
ncbi:MAG: hypothetical protein ACYTXY_07060, partial [Nostoc sp.]